MKYIGIIPARYASSRFPGKPLALISGQSMIQRTYRQAEKALKQVWVATDDERIEQEVRSFGGNVIMTSTEHKTGTDRCLEAAQKIAQTAHLLPGDVVLNIQGDEPFIKPEQILSLISCFDEKTQIATLIKKIDTAEELFNPNRPKVIFTTGKRAIYFSRQTIPFVKKADKNDWLSHFDFYKHIGMYAYRYDILQQITKIPQSPVELAESLEQNRWIEHGYSIRVEFTDYESMAVDTKEDLEKIKQNKSELGIGN